MREYAQEYSGWPETAGGGKGRRDTNPANNGGRTMKHTPVMVSQVLTYLPQKKLRIVLDGTVGAGGHAEALLESHSGLQLIGVDRDPTALRLARDRLARFGNRVRLIQGLYSDLGTILSGVGRVDGVLLDLGLSSMQLDEPARGFSYSSEGQLDMRMSQAGRTAGEWLQGAEVTEVATVLRRYGEIRQAKRIARVIKAAVDAGDVRSTTDIRAAVERALGATVKPADLSRVFQAIRIHVNDELELLEQFLGSILDFMNPGGRIVVISYHSLEDRAVKSFFKIQSATCICPPGTPVCTCARSPALRVLTPRVVKPSDVEVAANARSRSAKLRAAEVLRPGGNL
jgi:16S rRNA (cytosine1402-N4)-methyltransferase